MTKSLTSTLLLICCFAVATAQDHESLQPDSVYKNAHVRSRESYYQGASSKSKEIFVFDKSGRQIGFRLTDNETGKKPQLTIWYTYNDHNILTNEADTSFYNNNLTRVKYSTCAFDDKGRLIKKTMKVEGTVVSEISYYPDELKYTEHLYRNGSVYREQTTYYDKQGKDTRFTGTETVDKNVQPKTFMVNGKPFTFNPPKDDSSWDYVFKNTYDATNRLALKQRFEKNELKDETTYVYNSNGLLTEKRESRFGSVQVVKYNYVFYK